MPLSVRIKPNFITVTYMRGYWLDIFEIRGDDHFSGKVDYFHHYHMSLRILRLIFKVIRIIKCLWAPKQNLFLICYLYHYTCNRSCGTWTSRSWYHFSLTSCFLIPKQLSYLSSLFVSVPLLLLLLYLHAEWLYGHTFMQIWVEMHYQWFVYLRHGSLVVAH